MAAQPSLDEQGYRQSSPKLRIGKGYCAWPLRPRWPFGRIPKSLEKLTRPKLVLTAGIAHGWTTGLFLSQDNVSHGADAFLEVLRAPRFWRSSAFQHPLMQAGTLRMSICLRFVWSAQVSAA